MIYVIIQDVYFAIEMSILLCHIAFSYFVTLFAMLYFALFCLKMHYYYALHFLLFTLVFHYADETLCITLSARILVSSVAMSHGNEIE